MDSEFELRLRRQPVKPIPAAWRAEILTAAHTARPAGQPTPVTRRAGLSAINQQLATVLWPHPRAWAGLAAVWVLLLALNLCLRDSPPASATKSAPASPEMIGELKQQQRLYAELIGPAESRVANRQPVFSPKPRSARAEILAG